MKVLECSQHYTFIFKRSMAANSVVGDEIWQKFKLIQAFIDVLVTCKSDKNSSKYESARLLTIISLIISLWRFFSDVQGQLTP